MSAGIINVGDHLRLTTHIRAENAAGRDVRARVGSRRGALSVEDAEEHPDRIDAVWLHWRPWHGLGHPRREVLRSYDTLEMRTDRGWTPWARAVR